MIDSFYDFTQGRSFMKQIMNGDHWVEIQDGVLTAIGHRPAKNTIPVLAEQGFTHVVTILSPKEEEGTLLKLIRHAGMESIHIPVSSGAVPMSPENRKHFLMGIADMKTIINERGPDRLLKWYIHCSAGIHRTGMITFALLRSLGLEHKESLALLARIRPVTAQQVGTKRIRWVEENIISGRADNGSSSQCEYRDCLPSGGLKTSSRHLGFLWTKKTKSVSQPPSFAKAKPAEKVREP